jgi:predicted peroxiredoxin
MYDMPGVSIIVASNDGGRFYAALETAITASALGRSARVFLQGEAAELLRVPVSFAGDGAREAAGQPGLAGLLAEAAAMDVDLFVCQSGMLLVGMTASELVPQVRAGGLVGFLADAAPDDQLLSY